MKKNYVAFILFTIGSVALIGGSVLVPASAYAKEKKKDRNKSANTEVVLTIAGTDGSAKVDGIVKTKNSRVKNPSASLAQALKDIEARGAETDVALSRGLLRKLINFLQTLGFIILPPGSIPSPASGDTLAPTIRATHADHIATSSAEVFWETNEPANSRVFYGTTSPVYIDSNTTSLFDDDYARTHRLTLTGLTANTAYHYRVASADRSGNTTQSNEFSFTTKAVQPTPSPDRTAPALLSITASEVGSTSARIRWTTNEPATGSVWYGTTTPVTMAPPFEHVSSTSLNIAHDFILSGLSASTTHRYRVSSSDQHGNTSASDDSSFVTLIN